MRTETSGTAGLYVHFPFCSGKCPYCHFSSAIYEARAFETWRRGLAFEAALRAAPGLEFETLYLGGGTPSLMPPAALEDLRRTLEHFFPLTPGEFTLEANPAAEIRMEIFDGWLRAGVTRLSVGVQSFDDPTLEILGRDYSARGAEGYVKAARRAGFPSINLDLMIGIPGAGRDALEKTLKIAASLEPDHVSLYLLENVEGLPFEEVLRGAPVDEDEAANAFEWMAAGLESMGLRRYEISNFAKPGHECRHNLKYWRYEPFLGLGPSAASHIESERWTNENGLETWSSALASGGDPRAETTALGPENRIREAVVVGLRLVQGIEIEAFRLRFGVDLRERFGPEIRDLVGDGSIVLDRGFLRIPAEKLLVSNRILACFV